MNINTKRLFSIVSLSCAVFACSSSDNEPQTNITLSKPLADRQILALENSTLRADITINADPVQSFIVSPGQTLLQAGVTGVVLDANNRIEIKWIELLNGFEVEISDQVQSFFADGFTTITAPHESNQYDYDNDGDSNLRERAEGNCVWSAIESCLNSGQTDVPAADSTQVVATPSEPVNTGVNAGVTSTGLTAREATFDTTIPQPNYLFDYANADDFVINGDFSAGVAPWGTSQSVLTATGQDLCGRLPQTNIEIFDDLYYYGEFFAVGPGRYSFEFDIRADRETIASFTLTTPGVGAAIIDQHLSVNQVWDRKIISYQHLGETVTGAIGFRVLRGQETTWCIDNVSLLKER